FTPDGKTLITCGHDHTIRFWNIPAATERRSSRIRLPDGTDASLLTLSSDGRRLAATESYARRYYLWDISGENPVPLANWASDLAVAANLALSSDGKTLFAGGVMSASVEVFDLADPTAPRRL